MPSASYVAQALYSVGAETDWEDASAEDQSTHMALARVAIASIQSWQVQHKIDGGSDRYCMEHFPTEDNANVWGIYDKKIGRDKPLGEIHDALLAQQIVDDLNKRDAAKKPLKAILEEIAPT